MSTLPQTNLRRRAAQTADERASLLEQWCQDLIDALLHERRVELPRLERHATESLAMAQERFQGERRIARAVLDTDIPRKERALDAALLILQCADYKKRAVFILRDWTQRNSMISEVLRSGGLVSDSGKWVSL